MREVTIKLFTFDELSYVAQKAVVRHWIDQHAKRITQSEEVSNQFLSIRGRVRQQSKREEEDLRLYGVTVRGQIYTEEQVTSLIRSEQEEYTNDGSSWQKWREGSS